MINKMKRFKLQILVAITVGAFTTFTMLLYATSESGRCDVDSNILCFYVYRDDRSLTRNATPRRESEAERSHHFRARVLYVKSVTTERLGNLGAPSVVRNYTLSDYLRTRRNIKDEWNSSNIIQQKATTKAYGIARSAQTSPSTKKYGNDSMADDEYFYIVPSGVALSDNENLKSSWTRDALRYYSDRQTRLQVGCDKYYNVSRVLRVKRVKLDHILIDESRKILFCYVPKVACTNWKRIFMLLTGKANNISQVVRIPAHKVHVRNLFASLQNYSLSEVNRVLHDYTKVIFVRNPFERLLSAYHNKLEQHYESSKYFQSRFGKYIIRKFRKNPSNASLERGDDVTFPEFVDYLTTSDSDTYNEHWQTVANLCHPCFVNYDIIGKYETLLNDSNFVLDYLKMNVTFPVLEKPSRTASSLKKYFNALSRDAIYKLYKIYEMDFKLFGYDLFDTLDWPSGGSS